MTILSDWPVRQRCSWRAERRSKWEKAQGKASELSAHDGMKG